MIINVSAGGADDDVSGSGRTMLFHCVAQVVSLMYFNVAVWTQCGVNHTGDFKSSQCFSDLMHLRGISVTFLPMDALHKLQEKQKYSHFFSAIYFSARFLSPVLFVNSIFLGK